MSNGPKIIRGKTCFFIVPAGLFLWFCIVVVRLVDLHTGEHDCHNQVQTRGEEAAYRGVIYDRLEHPIAVNQPGYSIFVDPKAPVKEGQSKEATAHRVAELTGRKYEDVYRDITGNGKSSRYIIQGITLDESAVDLRTNKTLYCCVGLNDITLREYPQGKYFSHIVGYISGNDEVGRNGGVEQQVESFLHGKSGFYEGYKDRNGSEIHEWRHTTVNAINGASVYLTIDQEIQCMVCDELEKGIAKYRATGGKVIIQMVQTGEILAMVSCPNFDPNNFRDYSVASRRNATIGAVYDPGSTMKAITVAAALNEGIVWPDKTYDVGHGVWHYGGHRLRDHPEGVITVRQIIQKSSNIGAAHIALELGNKMFERYIKAFGITELTGIDLPGEERGLLPPSEKWTAVKPTRVAMGQGISVTPIQMVNAYCTIANGGHRMRPYVISRVVSSSGETLIRNEPNEKGRPITPEVAREMRKMLETVTYYDRDKSLRGTGWRARLEGYTVAGKTGTAQMIDEHGHYSETDYWSSFIGFVPAENPVFCMIVVLDRPRGEIKDDGSIGYHDGGATAAPLFSSIAQQVAQHLEIPLMKKNEEKKNEEKK